VALRDLPFPLAVSPGISPPAKPTAKGSLHGQIEETGEVRRPGSFTSGSTARSRTAKQDAIALLKADHRQVEEWFEQFEKTGSDSRKQDLANRICMALKAHTTIEEEIFYPAFLEATEEEDIHHEAEVEHEGAKRLIEQIEASSPEDDYFDAKVTVLSEMIKHHVREEEKRDGMFAKARQSQMDLEALGEQLAQRKAQIMSGESEGDEDARPAAGRAARMREAQMNARSARRR
jgi:hemerythrin superfamily protein